jgi:GT2 family glycosyltransferase
LPPTESHSQHVVTAVIVAHDGAVWLPHGISGLESQTRPVQRVVAVDTGSRDRSGSVLASRLGQGVVFGMDRSTGYAAAVRRAVTHKAATAPLQVSSGGGLRGSAAASSGRGRAEHAEWIWLLHDDCEPAPDALEQLLRGADETPGAAVVGPKLKDWADRDVILEAGVTLDTVGRRITGIEPREIDQGQHDGDRDTLAVSSAGMLIRRDVWDLVGGFDPGMTLFGEDIDFCWRVHAAGYRVRVVTDAIVYHAQAASKGRRHISVGRRVRLLQRRNGLMALLANLPFGPMVAAVIGNVTVSLLRTFFFLIAKRPAAALDESAAVTSVIGHPLRLASARGRRARGRRAAFSRLRGDLPPGRSIRRIAEFAASVMSRSTQLDTVGSHHASDDPTDDDSLLVDTGIVQRVLTRPGVLLVLALMVIAGVAERSIIGGGTLGGGMLLPAWEGSSGLWGEFLQSFHPSGVGSASFGPPYVALIALLATILLGKAWLAVDVLLLGSVPLAGATAVLALRYVTTSVTVRIWAAASYALLPVVFGAIAGGRLGSAIAFVLIPLIGLLAGRMFTKPRKLARRAAWAIGLTVAVGAAFVPLLWPMVLAAAVLGAVTVARAKPAMLVNLAIAAVTPAVLLMPWLAGLLTHPSLFLLEAGVQQPGLAASRLAGRYLLLLSPGGPGLPPYWVSGALLLAGIAGLLSSRRRMLIVSGWCVAVFGYAVALGIGRVTVTPPGGQPVTAWPGIPLAVAAAGLLLAAAAAGDGLRHRFPASVRSRSRLRRSGGMRGLAFGVAALVAVTAPLLAAAYWLKDGVSGPIRPASGQVVPALVSVSGGAGGQVRTLVLSSAGGHVSYLLLRGDSPNFSDPGITPNAAAQNALSNAVAELVAPGGGEAVDQAKLLADFDIGFVLMRAPLNQTLASQLDGVVGLTNVSTTATFDLWRLTDLPTRVSVVEANGTVVPISSGPVGVTGATAPASGGTLELAEPAGGWTAALNGHALTPVASPAGSWAQAFRLPPGGGTLSISRSGLGHDLLTALELILFLIVAALALPGVRSAAEIEAAGAHAGGAGEDVRASGAGRGSAAGHAGRDGFAADAGVTAAADDVAETAVTAAAAVAGALAGGLGLDPAGRLPEPARLAGSGRLAGPDRLAAPGRSGVPDAPVGADGATAARARGIARDGEGHSRRTRGVTSGRLGRSGRGVRRSRADDDVQAQAETDQADRRGDGQSAGTWLGRAARGRGGRRPVTGPGAAGAGAAGAGLAGAAGAARTGAGDAGAARTGAGAGRPGAPGTGTTPTGSGRRAAWPAGQPSSRFIAPPQSNHRGRHTGEAAGRDLDEELDARGRGPRPGGRAASPSGSGYPAEADPRDLGYPSQPRYPSQQGYQGGEPSDIGYRSASGRRRAPDYEAEPGLTEPRPRRSRDWPQSAEGDRPRGDRWPDPQDDRTWSQPSGWPTPGEQPGWVEDYPVTPDARSGGQRASHQAWPTPGDALEALPPDAEIHHDWPERGRRAPRGWPEPADEREGDDW